MKLVALDDQHFDFLLHVFESYTRGGLPPAELGIAAATFQRIDGAREIPVEDLLNQAKIAELGPNGVALEVGPDVHDPEPR